MIIEILMLVAAAIIFIVVARKYPVTELEISQKKISVALIPSAARRLLLIPNLIGYLRSRWRILSAFILKKIDRRRSKILSPPDLPPSAQSQLDKDPLKIADQAFSRSEWDKAEEYYIKSAIISPRNSRIYSRLGVIYLEKKNYRDALEALTTAIENDDTVAARHYNLALVYSGLGNRKKTIASLNRALELDPGNEKYQRLREKLIE